MLELNLQCLVMDFGTIVLSEFLYLISNMQLKVFGFRHTSDTAASTTKNSPNLSDPSRGCHTVKVAFLLFVYPIAKPKTVWILPFDSTMYLSASFNKSFPRCFWVCNFATPITRPGYLFPMSRSCGRGDAQSLLLG